MPANPFPLPGTPPDWLASTHVEIDAIGNGRASLILPSALRLLNYIASQPTIKLDLREPTVRSALKVEKISHAQQRIGATRKPRLEVHCSRMIEDRICVLVQEAVEDLCYNATSYPAELGQGAGAIQK